MNTRNLWVGLTVMLGVVLFGAGLFMVGNQHRAFRRHIDFYAELANVSGISKGAKIRVDGLDAGQVQDIMIPSSPEQKFRLKLTLEDRLHGLIRKDSMVSIETEGLVGDKYLLIQGGTGRSPEAGSGTTLPSKEPVALGRILERANGLLAQVGATVGDVQGQLDTTLKAVTGTVNNTNGLVTDVRQGKGAAGVLLEDPATAASVKQTVLNAQHATGSLDATAGSVDNVVQQVQQRQIVAKVDDTLINTRNASQQLEQTTQQLNGTLQTAFAEDENGRTAGANLQQSLTNINEATGNLADDTEALKHEFFFKGFFKKRGYDSLDHLPIDTYRNGTLLRKAPQSRSWLPAAALFESAPDGTERLSPAGREQLDQAVSKIQDLYGSPVLVEGYSDNGTAGQKLLQSRNRAKIVRAYLQVQYSLPAQDMGIIGLSSVPPENAGQSTWDGVCLVRLASAK